MSDLWQGVGTRGGVIERTAATDGSWDYLPNQGGGVQPGGTYRGGGIQLNGPSTSGDIIEYQSCELPGVTIPPQDRTNIFPPFTWPVGSGLLNFLINVDFATNITVGGVPAVMGKFIWRFGFTKSSRLTNPPQGIYYEKTAGITAADATWYIVARDGSGEQREAVAYVIPGLSELPDIRSFGIFTLWNRIMTRGYLTTQYLSTHIPTDGMNIFIQIIPSDAAVDSHFQVLNYNYGGQLYNLSLQGAGANFFPGWSDPIGKLGWTVKALDYYGYAAFGNSGARVQPFRSPANHPGVLTISAAQSNFYGFTPDGMGGGTPSESSTTTSMMAPTGGVQFKLSQGYWKQRFLIHLGDNNVFSLWDPNQPISAAVGLTLGPAAPFGIPSLPTVGFYILGSDEESPVTGQWRWHNAFSPTPEDIPTGIIAADPNLVNVPGWFMLEIEKFPLRNQIIGRIYTSNRDGTDRILWEHTGAYDTASWDGNLAGPLYYVHRGVLDNTNVEAIMQIDAYGVKMNLAQTAAA